MGTVRLPRFDGSSTCAPMAKSGTAVEDGCTMAHVPLFMMAWYWFSPVWAWHALLVSPFFLQSKSLERKYQQRGSCMMLPPSVPVFPTHVLAACPAAPDAAFCC